MYYHYHKPITLQKGKSKITIAFGIGGFNPDESKEKGLLNGRFAFDRHPWLKFENDVWHYIKDAWRFTALEQIADYIKKDAYSEEQFLTNVFEIV